MSTVCLGVVVTKFNTVSSVYVARREGYRENRKRIIDNVPRLKGMKFTLNAALVCYDNYCPRHERLNLIHVNVVMLTAFS